LAMVAEDLVEAFMIAPEVTLIYKGEQRHILHIVSLLLLLTRCCILAKTLRLYLIQVNYF